MIYIKNDAHGILQVRAISPLQKEKGWYVYDLENDKAVDGVEVEEKQTLDDYLEENQDETFLAYAVFKLKNNGEPAARPQKVFDFEGENNKARLAAAEKWMADKNKDPKKHVIKTREM